MVRWSKNIQLDVHHSCMYILDTTFWSGRGCADVIRETETCTRSRIEKMVLYSITSGGGYRFDRHIRPEECWDSRHLRHLEKGYNSYLIDE